MKKCQICKSCLKSVWVLPNHYLYCDLCRKVYTINFEGLTEVTDYDTIEAVKQIYGVRIY